MYFWTSPIVATIAALYTQSWNTVVSTKAHMCGLDIQKPLIPTHAHGGARGSLQGKRTCHRLCMNVMCNIYHPLVNISRDLLSIKDKRTPCEQSCEEKPRLYPCHPPDKSKKNFQNRPIARYSSASRIRPEALRENNLAVQTLRTSSYWLELHFSPVAQTPLTLSVAHEFAVDWAV